MYCGESSGVKFSAGIEVWEDKLWRTMLQREGKAVVGEVKSLEGSLV